MEKDSTAAQLDREEYAALRRAIAARGQLRAVLFVAGLTAPKGRRMGHAGAIISAAGDSAAEKAEIMRSCGLTVAPNPSEFGSTVAGVLAKRPERRAAV